MIDGDSIRVLHDGKAEQIRLLGIDCPEKRQPFGTQAKEYRSVFAVGRDVTVYGNKRDGYGGWPRSCCRMAAACIRNSSGWFGLRASSLRHQLRKIASAECASPRRKPIRVFSFAMRF